MSHGKSLTLESDRRTEVEVVTERTNMIFDAGRLDEHKTTLYGAYRVIDMEKCVKTEEKEIDDFKDTQNFESKRNFGRY